MVCPGGFAGSLAAAMLKIRNPDDLKGLGKPESFR
jgi:hypothetical protein